MCAMSAGFFWHAYCLKINRNSCFFHTSRKVCISIIGEHSSNKLLLGLTQTTCIARVNKEFCAHGNPNCLRADIYTYYQVSFSVMYAQTLVQCWSSNTVNSNPCYESVACPTPKPSPIHAFKRSSCSYIQLLHTSS